MLVLSLFLSAAAGVNAYLGGDVSAVKVSPEEVICANNCVFRDVYFSQDGHWCPRGELVLISDGKGEVDPEAPFDCTGMALPAGYTEGRRPSQGEPQECDNYPIAHLDAGCYALRSPGAKSPQQVVEWSDIERELASAAGQGAQQGQQQQQSCQGRGQEALLKCREAGGDFNTCNALVAQALRKCSEGQ